jgi:UDP-MurNAc hydroxylase
MVNPLTVTYFYSACVGITTPDTSILCDPWFTDGAYDGSWYQYPKLQDPLGKIPAHDYVYISHIHPDHYDPIFLKAYLELHPSTKVIIADFKSNFLLARMRGEGVPHDVVEKLVIGDSSIGIFPNELRSYDIDSALAVYWKDQSVINMNDNPYRESHVQRILDFIPNRPTIALLGYTGAGPYPQTYHTDEKTLLSKAEDKKQAFFKRYKEMADSIDAKVNIPFAGKYILGGKLSHLNRFRGVADAVEVTQFDPKAVVLEDAGRGSIDCASLQPSAVRTRPYNTEEMESYAASLSSLSMKYETLFPGLQLEDIPFRRLLPKAHQTAQRRSECEEDCYMCLRVGKEWFVSNARKGSDHGRFTNTVEDLVPRSEITIDPRYLYGLITMIFHWNNAEVGSHYMVKRVPDILSRPAQAFLNYFHV